MWSLVYYSTKSLGTSWHPWLHTFSVTYIQPWFNEKRNPVLCKSTCVLQSPYFHMFLCFISRLVSLEFYHVPLLRKIVKEHLSWFLFAFHLLDPLFSNVADLILLRCMPCFFTKSLMRFLKKMKWIYDRNDWWRRTAGMPRLPRVCLMTSSPSSLVWEIPFRTMTCRTSSVLSVFGHPT